MKLMVEFDRSSEGGWYLVHVSNLASFVVRSYTENGAKQKADYYLEQNIFLNIDPLGLFSHPFELSLSIHLNRGVMKGLVTK